MAKEEKEKQEKQEEKKEEKKDQKKPVKTVAKAKTKKKWVQIIAPGSFNSLHLGESLVDDPGRLVGKTVTANLMTLTNDMRNQGIEIRFDIVKVHESKGHAAATGYALLPSQLKRLVRRGRSKIGDSFVVRNQNGRLVRIKPVVLTATPASSGAQTQIRLAVRNRTKQLVAGMSFDRLVHELINYQVQRALKDVANKTHPVRGVEIVACFLLPEGTSDARTVREDETTVINEAVAPEAEAPADDGQVEDLTEDAETGEDADLLVDDAEADEDLAVDPESSETTTKPSDE